MSTKINFNKSVFYSGVFLLIFCLGCICFCSYNVISVPPKPFLSHRGIRNGAVVIFSLYIMARYANSLYTTPYQVSVDDDLKLFELKYLFRKPQVVHRDHMVSYNPTTINISTRSGTTSYSGLSLNLLDETKILFSERSLEDCSYIQSMLDYWGDKKLESLEE